MFRPSLRLGVQAFSSRSVALTLALFAGNLLFNVLSNAAFKASATSPNWRSFLSWQVVGNFSGFVTVITLTWLLRFVPLHVAYPVTAGLAVVGVQVVAARLVFGEAISPSQWLGTLLVVGGIALIGGR